MISISPSNLHCLKDYYENTKQQLQTLQNEVRFISDEQSPQINMKALIDVLSNCEESIAISLQLFKLCQQTLQDKTFFQNQAAHIKQQNQMLMRQNKDLFDTVQTLQLNKRQNSILFSEFQKQINLKTQQRDRQMINFDFLEEFNRKEAIYKIQLQHYDNQFKYQSKRINSLQQQLGNSKKQMSIKMIQLELAQLVLQDLWKQKNSEFIKQSKVGETYSPSLNLSYEDLMCSKISIQQMAKNKKCSLMQDLVESQICLPQIPFSSHLNKSNQTLPEIQQETSKTKDDFGNLQCQSKISISSACREENTNLIYSKIIQSRSISYGVQTQNTSLSKRMHDWLRRKVVTERIKM